MGRAATGRSEARTSSRFAFALLFFLMLAVGVMPESGQGQLVMLQPGGFSLAGRSAAPGATLVVLGGIEGVGPDVASAAIAALTAAEARLAEVGLDRNDLLRVRAALAPGDGSEFAAWDTAWRTFFVGQGAARVTVGASALPGEALIVLDLVAAFPEPTLTPADLGRPTLNPHIRYAGPVENPTAIVSTRAGLFLSAGILGSRAGLSDPDSMEAQIRSAMNRLTGTLGDHGLQWSDAFFLRVLPTPQPDRDTPDFAGWAPVQADLAAALGGSAPPFTLWAAPGFSGNGTFIEIEVWAVPQAPMAPFAVYDREAANPRLRVTGPPTSAISNGAMIAPNSELLWLSEITAAAGVSPENEGAAALAEMKDLLENVGASMGDVAELRVYRTEGEAGFNEAYAAHFNNPETNPHKPVRTNYLVESLPGGRSVLVEAVVVRPSPTF